MLSVLLNRRFSSQLGRLSSALKVGIVGMANIGKSSTFNLLSGLSVPAENVPFCTIDPNNAVVQVSDPRFQSLCQLYKPAKRSGPVLRVIDIAGLVKGASEGFGLGNQFLSNISQVDGIFQVVRCFPRQQVTHTEGSVDPLRDIQIIAHQLCAKDSAQLEKTLKTLIDKHNRNKSQELKIQIQALSRAAYFLKKDLFLSKQTWKPFEIEPLNKLNLLTAKPILYCLNCSPDQNPGEVSDQLKKRGEESFVYSVQAQQAEKQPSAKMRQLAHRGYKLLNLIHFFTVGKDEVKAWTMRKGGSILDAAQCIHSDLRKGFVSANVANCSSLKGTNFQSTAKKVGKDYEVADGDILVINSKIKK